MLLHYIPDDGDRQTFTFKHDAVLSVEADAVEKVTGLTWDEVGAAFVKGSSKAQRAVLWIFLKRDNPALRFSELDGIRTGQIEREFDQDELAALKENLDRKADSLTDEEYRAIQDILTAHQFEAIVAAEQDDDDPKEQRSKRPSAARNASSTRSTDESAGTSSP